MASGLLDSVGNISLYTIPVAWVFAIAPHSWAITQTKSFDNRHPRKYGEALEKDQTIDKETRSRIFRAESAQTNNFENLGLFASAVVAGNAANLPAATLNALSLAYLASRLAYNFIYINNTSQALANVRSAVYMAGVGAVMTLFVKSGNVLREGAVLALGKV